MRRDLLARLNQVSFKEIKDAELAKQLTLLVESLKLILTELYGSIK